MSDLYVCGFTRVAYVLRHAEIRVQGYTEVFNRRRMHVVTKLCRDKHKYKRFVVSKIVCRNKQIFFCDKTFCHSKYTFVPTNDVFCRDGDKHVFVATKLLDKNDICGSSRQ